MRINVPVRGNRKLRTLIERVNADDQLKALVARLERERGRPDGDQRPLLGAHPDRHEHRAQAPAPADEARRRAGDGRATTGWSRTTPRSSSRSPRSPTASACRSTGTATRTSASSSPSRSCAQLLDGLYEEPDLTVIVSEVLQAIISHRADGEPLTLEAGIIRVADALDMEKGRSRIPFERGQRLDALALGGRDRGRHDRRRRGEADQDRDPDEQLVRASSRSTAC